MSSRFDLEKALAAWRRSLSYNRAFLEEDVDELERHLRDQVTHLGSRGLSEGAAFERAMAELGSYGAVEMEYRKVYWGKRRRRREVIHALVQGGAMIKNYLKIAWRNVLREKGYAVINVFGLAVGIAFCILIFLYVRDELTFDDFHVRADRLFRVEETTIQPDGSEQGGQYDLPIVLGPSLQADLPSIARFTHVHYEDHYVRPNGGDDAVEERILFADPAALEMFTFPLVQGAASSALAMPDNVVLTETAAHRLFGVDDPMGRTVQIRLEESFEEFVVTGIVGDVPGNSTIRFGLILPFQQLLATNEEFRRMSDDWHFYAVQTFVELMPNATEAQTESVLPAFFRKYHEEDIARERKEGTYDSSAVRSYDLKPIRDVHLTSDSRPVYSYILSGIALIVLLIACINFTTLAIGRSARRAREVGVRKVVGADRRQVMVQFWGEAILLSGIALGAGLVLAWAFLPVFNSLTEKALAISTFVDGSALIALIGLVLATGAIAGSYPALVLSRFRPIETLTNRLRLGRPSILTKSLVVLQFAFTVLLIACTLVMTRQLSYTSSMELGFDKEQIVVIPSRGVDAGRIAERFRAELEHQPSVLGVSASGNMLGRTGTMGVGFRDEAGGRHAISVFRVDTRYLDFLGLELVAGRNFDPRLPADTARAVVVNEALVRDFGFEDPIGETIPFPWAGPEDAPVIIGVVKDYHAQSAYREVGPVMLTMDPGWAFENLLVRIRPERIPQTLDVLRGTWKAAAPDAPFSYQFLDEQMQAQYENDRRWSRIVRYAALFAILIACLGLLGLAALSVTRRTKEIGIRKILGATMVQIVSLISREFVLLVVIGIAVASPVAYLAMHRWLEQFAYRVPLSGWVFLVAGLSALILAMLTVGIHAVRTSLENSAASLRYE